MGQRDRAHGLCLHLKLMHTSSAEIHGLGSLQLNPEENSHAGSKAL